METTVDDARGVMAAFTRASATREILATPGAARAVDSTSSGRSGPLETGGAQTRLVEREAGLVQRAQRGDHAAFDELAAAAFPRLWQIARRTLGDPARADDAVQECLVRAWRDLRALREPERFEAWLHRLLIRACTDDWRRARRAPAMVSVDHVEPVVEADVGAMTEQRDLLERAFLRLPVEQRIVVVLHHYVGLRVAEIAESSGIPEGTATSRLHYGLRALRAAVEADLRGSETSTVRKAAR